MKAAAPFVGAIGIAGNAGAQVATQQPGGIKFPETLTQNYITAAVDAAETSCPEPITEKRACARTIFESQTKLFIHWRNTAELYLYNLPTPKDKDAEHMISLTIGHVDEACRNKAKEVVEASKPDKSPADLSLALNKYQNGCAGALKEGTAFLQPYNMTFRATNADYGTLSTLAGRLTFGR